METPCADCMARMASVEEIFDPPPQNNIFLVERWFAYKEFRYFTMLSNQGVFCLYKARCQIGIGSRELDPEITTLKNLWKNTYGVGTDPRHGKNPRPGWANYAWGYDYWPTTRDILLAINANIILCEREPSYDAWLA